MREICCSLSYMSEYILHYYGCVFRVNTCYFCGTQITTVDNMAKLNNMDRGRALGFLQSGWSARRVTEHFGYHIQVKFKVS